VAEHNSNLFSSGNYFEIAQVYWKESGHMMEKTYLFMMSFDKSKIPSQKLTGSFHELCQRLGIAYELKQDEEQQATILVNHKPIGRIGAFDVSDLNWVGVSLDFEEFVKHISVSEFKPIPRFPAKEVDAAIVVKEDLL